MSKYDETYKDLVNDIINNGTSDKGQNVRTKWVDGEAAHSKEIFGVQLKFNELPIPTTKKLAWKVAIKEILLFWQHQSVKKEDFHNLNVHVWDEWFLEDNTIGKSYAYQFESRPRQDMILVKTKEVDYVNSFPKFIVMDMIQPNYNCTDEFVGKVFSSNSCGDFIVLDVFKEDNEPLKARVQFLDTGYTTTVFKIEINQGRVSDPYYKKILDIAAYGDLSGIKNLSNKQLKKLYRKWYHMVHRCYDPKDGNYKAYGSNNVKVHDKWLLFENYVRDVRYLPQWHLAKNDLDNWCLDKNYYESNLYSKETCVWLSKADNDIYQEQTRPEAGYVYRYKLSKNQVNELIYNIKNNPASRRLMTSFWNYADVEEKALQECAFQTQWRVQDGKLHLLLTQR